MAALRSSTPSSVDIANITEQAKAGSLPALRQLQVRIARQYGEHHTGILDAILSHLKAASSEDTDDDNDGMKEIHRKATAVACIAPLLEVSQWLQAQPTRTAVSVSTSLRLFSTAPDYIACLLDLLKTARADTNLPRLFHAVSLLCNSLLQSCPRLLSLFANSSNMLDIAIAMWATLYRGRPLLYPGGLPLSAPIVSEMGDPALRLFHALAVENPKEMANAIMEGRVCEPGVFIKRCIDRMGILPNIKVLPHLSHLKEPTVEIGNAHYIIMSLNALVQANYVLRNLLLSSPRNTTFITGVLANMGARLYERDPPLDPQHMDERVQHLLKLLDLMDYVVGWIATTSTNVVHNMRRIIDSGTFQLIGHCIPFIADQRYTKVESIYEKVVPYAFYRHNMRHFVASMSQLVTPQLVKTPDTSRRKGELGTTMMRIFPMRDFLEDGAQRAICDNLKHYSHVRRGSDGSTSTNRVCSRCHTVAYCSVQCQTEDWRAFHRAECQSMAREYYDHKSSKRLYPYRYRKLHTNILVYSFEAVELQRRSFDRFGAGAVSAEPLKVSTEVDLVWNDPDANTTDCSIDVENYITRTLPHIPDIIKPRFDALTSTFRRWTVRQRRRNPGPHQFSIGSLRLLERPFRFGEVDVMLLILLEQTNQLQILTETRFEEIEVTLQEFMDRGATAEPNYRIIGSLAYTMPRQIRRKARNEQVQRLVERYTSSRSGIVHSQIRI